jgi:hypothetical protein
MRFRWRVASRRHDGSFFESPFEDRLQARARWTNARERPLNVPAPADDVLVPDATLLLGRVADVI